MYIYIYIYIYIYRSPKNMASNCEVRPCVTYEDTEIGGHAHHTIAAGMDSMSIAIDTGSVPNPSSFPSATLALPGQPNERSFICIWACGILTI